MNKEEEKIKSIKAWGIVINGTLSDAYDSYNLAKNELEKQKKFRGIYKIIPVLITPIKNISN